MAKLCFCGAGQMGAPMARRLVDAGHDVIVWNRSPEKVDPLVAAGAGRANSPAEAAAGVEAAITMLASPDAVEEVVLGADGLAHGISPDAPLIEMSTIGPRAIRSLAERLSGVEIIDAPVLGSTPEAQNGSLKVFVGASAESFERVRDVLEIFGETIHVGPFGAGAATKLVVNSTLGAVQLAFGEALMLSDALDLDLGTTLDVLELSPLGGTVKKKRDKIESGIFEPNFKLALAVKDMKLVTETAEANGLNLPGTAAARDAFSAAQRDGLGDCDYSAVAAHLSGRRASPG